MQAVLSPKRKLFERAARLTKSRLYVDTLFSDLFNGVMKIFSFPSFGGGGANRSWCEIEYSRGGCYLPNHRYCGNVCIGGDGLSTKCPPGYRPSHAWGYQMTGCWCDTFQGRSIICCDCTPETNSPFQRSVEDCGEVVR